MGKVPLLLLSVTRILNTLSTLQQDHEQANKQITVNSTSSPAYSLHFFFPFFFHTAFLTGITLLKNRSYPYIYVPIQLVVPPSSLSFAHLFLCFPPPTPFLYSRKKASHPARAPPPPPNTETNQTFLWCLILPRFSSLDISHGRQSRVETGGDEEGQRKVVEALTWLFLFIYFVSFFFLFSPASPWTEKERRERERNTCSFARLPRWADKEISSPRQKKNSEKKKQKQKQRQDRWRVKMERAWIFHIVRPRARGMRCQVCVYKL